MGVLLVKVEEAPGKDDTNNGVEVVMAGGAVLRLETEDILAGGRSAEWVQKGTINMCLRKQVKEKRKSKLE